MEGFRIFLANGDTAQFGNINCIGLTQLTAHTFASYEEAIKHIDTSPNIHAGEFIIMPVYSHKKNEK